MNGYKLRYMFPTKCRGELERKTKQGIQKCRINWTELDPKTPKPWLDHGRLELTELAKNNIDIY